MTSLEDLFREDGIDLRGPGPNKSARCPFHDDRTASLSVNVDTDVYLCHACGEKGGPKNYLIKNRGLSEFEAHKLISDDSAPAPARPKTPPKVYSALPRHRIAEHPYHDKNGTHLFTVCRYPPLPADASADDKKRWHKCDVWTPVKGGWIAKGIEGTKPLYRLQKILTANPKQQIMIVEGEKCVEAVEKAFPKALVTTWANGGKAYERTDLTPLHGRRVLLVADADDVGRKAMRAIAALLHADCAAVRLALPEGETHDDVADWVDAGGGALVAEKLKALTKDAPKPKAKKKKAEPAPVPISINSGGLEKNPYFKVLGNVGESIAVMLHTHRILYFNRGALTQPSALISMCPIRDWWLNLSSRDALGSGVCQQIGGTLIGMSDRIGQIDPSAFIGRGFFRTPDRKLVWHLGDRLQANGKTMGLGDLTGVIPLAGPPIHLAPDAADHDDTQRLAEAVLACRWETEADAKRFMGWLVAAVIGGALEWRAHSWLSAPSGSGKSWLMDNLARRILGDFCVFTSDTSAAGLARAVRNDSVPVLFDEAEPTQTQVEAVLSILRISSGGGGSRLRADQNSTSGYNSTNYRFSALLSSVLVNRMNQANTTRFAKIRLAGRSQDSDARWPDVKAELTSALGDAGRFLTAIVREGEDILQRAEALTDNYISAGIGGRKAAIEAALTAGWEWWICSPDKVALAERDDETMADSTSLIQELLGIRLRHPSKGEQSVAKIILGNDEDGIAKDIGFRLNGDQLEIDPLNPAIKAQLSRTQWASVDIKETLLQIGGVRAMKNAVFFGARRARAVIVPRAVCEAVGVELFDRHAEGMEEQTEEPVADQAPADDDDHRGGCSDETVKSTPTHRLGPLQRPSNQGRGRE